MLFLCFLVIDFNLLLTDLLLDQLEDQMVLWFFQGL